MDSSAFRVTFGRQRCEIDRQSEKAVAHCGTAALL